MGKLDIFLLGSPRIELDNKPVEFDTRKASALLAYLVVTGKRCSRDTLAALLWPDYDQTRARAALRRTLSTLNQALSEDGQSWLDIDRESVSMKSGGGYTLDIDQFHQKLAACRGHTHSSAEACNACAASLEEAAALYRDDFLAGFTLRDSPTFDDWQFFQTENLQHELEGALEKLATLLGSQGEFDRAIAYARRWLSLDPLNESASRQLMLLYAWAGNRSAALRQYRECVRILEQELDVAPLEETTQLYQSILENNLPLAPAPLQARPQPTGPVGLETTPETRLRDHDFPLVGRSQEWQVLLHTYEKLSKDGFFFVLIGEAGIGKTRLAEEFLGYTRAKGAAEVVARCYEGETELAYGPLIDGLRAALTQPGGIDRLKKVPAHWIGEAARLLPELYIHFPELPQAMPWEASAAGPGAQSRFFEGLRQVVASLCQGDPPGLLFFDDVHWADAATLDLLNYLTRRLKGFPCLILITRRLDATPSDERLDRLVAAVQREGFGNQVALSRLNSTDVDNLLRLLTASSQPMPEQINQRLHAESEGLPFFLVEYLSTILEEIKTGEPFDWSIPRNVRELLHSRLASVSETGWQLLTAAAVIGRSFDPDLLREASGRNESETIEALEGLVAQGLIRESSSSEVSSSADATGTGLSTYDFSHEKLRTLVYEETSLARRRLLHRRVAEALVNQGHAWHKMEGLASKIAQHYRLAGQGGQAAEYYKLAGEYAFSLFANTEALAHFRAALELGHPDVAQINVVIGDLLTLQGEYSTALASYEKAADLKDQNSAAAIQQKLGNVHDRRGEWDQAESHFQSALAALRQNGDPARRARLYADWSLTAYKRGQTGRSEELVKQALQLSEIADDIYAQAQAHNILGILARSSGDFSIAKAHLEQSMALAEKSADAYIRSAALNNLALVCADQGDLAQAISLAKSALEISARLGDRHREAAIRNNLADFFHTTGQSEQAMDSLKKAVVIFAEIGLEAGSLSPEIWKLREW